MLTELAQLLPYLGITAAIQVSFFILAYLLKTDKFTDLAYGSTFAILAVIAYSQSINQTLAYLLIMILVVLWGIRLSGYLFIRILKISKDSRFDTIRENFIKFASFWTLQTFAIWIIALPYLHVFTTKSSAVNPILFSLGIVIWILGIIIETIADLQKFKFKSDKRNSGKWIQTGIWKYSRHPNYFGEMLVWWGCYLACMSIISARAWLYLVSPLFISYILLLVTGIPPLEKKYLQRYRNNPEYQKYLETSNLLVPLPRIS